MFKLQYYLLILTFPEFIKIKKAISKLLGGQMPSCPPPPPVATALRLALGILQGRGGISLLGNEDERIFRGHVLPEQPELLVIFYKLLS